MPEGVSFNDMVTLKGNKDSGDRINKIIGALAEENDLKGVIDVADFNELSKVADEAPRGLTIYGHSNSHHGVS